MDARDLETALAITPRFYPAALDFDQWPAVLKDLIGVFRARAANVNLGKIQTQDLIATAQYGVSEEDLARFLRIENHLETDPRLAKSLHLPNRPIFERQLMSEAEWHASRMYCEVMAPAGLDSTLATHMLVEDDGIFAAIGLLRGLGDPDYNDDDVARFHLYLPHFREAMRCAARVHRAEVHSNTLAELFDWMRVAILVTDRFGAIRHANGPARALIDDGDGLMSAHDRVAASNSAASQALHEAIFRTVAGARPGEARTLVRLPRRGRPNDLLVSVVRVGAAAGLDTPSYRLLAALFVIDPERRYEGDAEALQRLFGLTQAEAAVMVSVGAGRTPRETAAAMNRSYETVRSHLKTIYGKTGARSQADVVRLVQAVAIPKRGCGQRPAP